MGWEPVLASPSGLKGSVGTCIGNPRQATGKNRIAHHGGNARDGVPSTCFCAAADRRCSCKDGADQLLFVLAPFNRATTVLFELLDSSLSESESRQSGRSWNNPFVSLDPRRRNSSHKEEAVFSRQRCDSPIAISVSTCKGARFKMFPSGSAPLG